MSKFTRIARADVPVAPAGRPSWRKRREQAREAWAGVLERTFGRLWAYRMHHPSLAAELTDEEILSLPGLGAKALAEIRSVPEAQRREPVPE